MALLERNKNLRVNIIEEGLLKVEVSMLDNIHFISTTFHVAFKSREIKHAEADIKKAPYAKVCKLVTQKMENLIGLRVDRGFTEKVVAVLGGEKGCPHLVDQTLEMAKSLAQFIDKSTNFPLGDYLEDAPLMREKVFEAFPSVKNMCWAYNVENNHLFTKDVKCGLQEDLII